MSRLRALPIAAIALLALLAPAAGANAEPPPPSDLHVDGGEERWRPTNLFRLRWRNPEAASGPAVAAVHYRVLNPLGAVVVGPTRLGWAADLLHDLGVPELPGAYTAEVWLEDTAGNEGAPASAKLRFDDARPPAATPRQPSEWIGRTGFPYTARIDRSPAPPPSSGIQGYAVSIDRLPRATPCAGSSRCSDSETNLDGGADEDSFLVPELPEGTSYLHVVAVSGSGMRSEAVGHATLKVDKSDPETRLSGIPDGWANHSLVLAARATDLGAGMSGGGAFTAIQVDGGVPARAGGDLIRTAVIDEGVHRIAYYARDAAGNVNDGASSNGQPNHSPAIATVGIDRDPPAVAFAGSQDPGDPELIEVKVADALSGPSSSAGSIGLRRVGSGDPFESLPTANVEGRLLSRWDSEAYGVGEYEFRAAGYDAAGNVSIASQRSDGTGMVLSSPLKASTNLVGGLGHNQARHRVVASGRETRFSGRLTTGLATPLEGAGVTIVERFAGGSGQTERISTVRTGPDGAFAIQLGPGPSREVVAFFAGTGILGRAATASASLAVRGEVRLRVSATTATVGGRPVIFTGRVVVARGTVPDDGKAVALQFRLPGLPWAEFRTIQTDRRGRFRYVYRFADDDSRGVRFQFRAYAPAQGNWPFEPGSSRPVAVRGR